MILFKLCPRCLVDWRVSNHQQKKSYRGLEGIVEFLGVQGFSSHLSICLFGFSESARFDDRMVWYVHAKLCGLVVGFHLDICIQQPPFIFLRGIESCQSCPKNIDSTWLFSPFRGFVVHLKESWEEISKFSIPQENGA